ncbi:MAG TPA: tripartite tricarboxylate transporter substrate binding protein [Xanthobacteraceae bacterium]|nr:tripartite tricarboxylate transporter substrate binding protein [Xanthobacteraceae bacterium]
MSTAKAEIYPDRPIRLIVPFAAGGTVDIIARIVGAKLSEIAGSKVVVENRGGAGGIIGTETTVQAPGDGYTLLIQSGSITYDPSLHDKLPYDTMKDLAPVAIIGTTPNLLVVTPSLSARSAHDLIRMAREKPGSITYGTGGVGSSSHLAVALLSLLSGAEFSHVPYKGAGPALADVVAGHVDFTVATMPAAIQQVRSSGLRALGISSQTRSPELPDVPTISETGLPGYEFVAWFGVFAPGTTRPELVARINALLREALNSPDMRDRLRIQGVEPKIQSPDQFRETVRSEIERWVPIIEKLGIKGL